jgi:hypothetical protein
VQKILKIPSPAMVVALIALFVALTGSAAAVTVAFAQNSDKVDGKHAVGYGASLSARKGKLVATSTANGRVPDSQKLQGRTWSKFLKDVVLVVQSSGSVNTGTFGTATASCPAGYKAIAGGVDPQNVFTMQVTSSAPTTGASARLYANADGTTKATGWHGAVLNNTGSTQNPGFKVGVICAKF